MRCFQDRGDLLAAPAGAGAAHEADRGGGDAGGAARRRRRRHRGRVSVSILLLTSHTTILWNVVPILCSILLYFVSFTLYGA